MMDKKIFHDIKFPKYLIILVLIPLCLYIQTLFFQLIFFDDNILVNNYFKHSEWINKIVHVFSSNYLDGHYYRPITILSLLFDSLIGQGSIVYFHLTNVLIHLITISTLFLLLRKMDYSKNSAFVAALFFAVTTIQVNAVAWIAGRADLLAGMFSVVSFFYWYSYQKTGGLRYALITLLSVSFAILSKETALLVPVIIFLYFLLDKYKAALKTKMFFLVAILLTLNIFYIQIRLWLLEYVKTEKLNFKTLLENLFIIPEIISKTFIPFGIKALAAYSVFNTISGIIIGMILFIIPFVFKNIERKKYYVAYISFFLLMIPGLFFRTNPLDQSYYWDCRSYLALIFIAFMIAEIGTVVFQFHIRKKVIPIVACYFVIIIAGSIYHIRKYENPVIYWGNVHKDYPNGYLSYSLLSQYYLSVGNNVQAELFLRNAVNLSPYHAKLRERLFDYYMNNKLPYKAYEVVNVGLKYTPNEDALVRDLILGSVFLGKVELIDDYFFNTPHEKPLLQKLYTILIDEASLYQKYLAEADNLKFQERIKRMSKINAFLQSNAFSRDKL